MQIKSWFFIFLMTILALTGIYSQSSLSYYEGDVTVLRNSREMEADFGMDLLTGDLIRSGRNSVAIIEMEHGRTLKLREDSSLVLENLSRQTSVALKKGSVFSRVERLSGGSFNVHTDAVVAGVRGTEFFMAFGETIDHEPDLWLCVNEGTVEVSLKKGDESVLVEEGEGINIPGSAVLTKPEVYSWTKDLNWNMDSSSGDVKDTTDLKGAYTDLLDQDYF